LIPGDLKFKCRFHVYMCFKKRVPFSVVPLLESLSQSEDGFEWMNEMRLHLSSLALVGLTWDKLDWISVEILHLFVNVSYH